LQNLHLKRFVFGQRSLCCGTYLGRAPQFGQVY
jgi:hypothetical protein